MKRFSYFMTGDGAIVQAPPISDVVFKRTLAATVDQQVIVPTGARLAVFSCTGDFLLKDGASIAVPGASSDASPEFNPVSRQVTAGSVFSVIAEADCVLYIAFYE